MGAGSARREFIMPTYISLIRVTQKGVETIREGAKRLDAANKYFVMLVPS